LTHLRFAHLRFDVRLSHWLCVRRLSLFLPRPRRHGRIMALGGLPMPMTLAITRGATSPLMAFATWRAGRDGMPALLR
jgi:hypothetical protein